MRQASGDDADLTLSPICVFSDTHKFASCEDETFPHSKANCISSMDGSKQFANMKQILAFTKELANSGHPSSSPVFIMNPELFLRNGLSLETGMSFGERVKNKLHRVDILPGKQSDTTDNPRDPYAFSDGSITANTSTADRRLDVTGNNTVAHASTVNVNFGIGARSRMEVLTPVCVQSDKVKQDVNRVQPAPTIAPVGSLFSGGSGGGVSALAKLYPELAEKLERCKQKTLEINRAAKGGKNASSQQTMNQLQSRIAQNRIKDRLKRTKEPSLSSRKRVKTTPPQLDKLKLSENSALSSFIMAPSKVPTSICVAQNNKTSVQQLCQIPVTVMPISTDPVGKKRPDNISRIDSVVDTSMVTAKRPAVKRRPGACASHSPRVHSRTGQPVSDALLSSKPGSHVARNASTKSLRSVHVRSAAATLDDARPSLYAPPTSIETVKDRTSCKWCVDYLLSYVCERRSDHDLLRYEPTTVDDCCDRDDSLPHQSHWFSPSSEEDDTCDEGDLPDVELSRQIRATKLTLLRDRLRRQNAQISRAQRANRSITEHCRSMAQLLVKALRSDIRGAHLALRHTTDNYDLKSTNRLRRKRVKRRVCLHKNGDDLQCTETALPYTNHCIKHILYNVDQQLFDYCTAKFADNTQCCIPVFDPRHELPLCLEHATKADNYAKLLPVDKRRPRKKTRPSALTRPPKKGKKKKNQRRKALLALATSQPLEDASEEEVDEKGDAPPDADKQTHQELHVPVYPGKSGDVSGAHPLEVHEFHDFKIQDDDFERLFSGKNGGLELSSDEWERMFVGGGITTRDEELPRQLPLTDHGLGGSELMGGLQESDVIAALNHDSINALASGFENNLLDATAISPPRHHLAYHQQPQSVPPSVKLPSHSSEVILPASSSTYPLSTLDTPSSSSGLAALQGYNLDLSQLTLEQLNLIVAIVAGSGHASAGVCTSTNTVVSTSNPITTCAASASSCHSECVANATQLNHLADSSHLLSPSRHCPLSDYTSPSNTVIPVSHQHRPVECSGHNAVIPVSHHQNRQTDGSGQSSYTANIPNLRYVMTPSLAISSSHVTTPMQISQSKQNNYPAVVHRSRDAVHNVVNTPLTVANPQLTRSLQRPVNRHPETESHSLSTPYSIPSQDQHARTKASKPFPPSTADTFALNTNSSKSTPIQPVYHSATHANVRSKSELLSSIVQYVAPVSVRSKDSLSIHDDRSKNTSWSSTSPLCNPLIAAQLSSKTTESFYTADTSKRNPNSLSQSTNIVPTSTDSESNSLRDLLS